MHLRFAKVGAVLILLFPAIASSREWLSSNGKHRVDAEMIAATREIVQLRRSDGKVVTVQVGRLSSADQRYVHEQVGATLANVAELENQLAASERKASQLMAQVRHLEDQLAQKTGENQQLVATLQQLRQPAAAVPPVPLRGAVAQGGMMYAAVGSGHWVKTTSSDGAVVVLEDGSTWQIESLSRIDSMLWLMADPIAVVDNPRGMLLYRLVNESSGDVVEAKLLGW